MKPPFPRWLLLLGILFSALFPAASEITLPGSVPACSNITTLYSAQTKGSFPEVSLTSNVDSTLPYTSTACPLLLTLLRAQPSTPQASNKSPKAFSHEIFRCDWVGGQRRNIGKFPFRFCRHVFAFPIFLFPVAPRHPQSLSPPTRAEPQPSGVPTRDPVPHGRPGQPEPHRSDFSGMPPKSHQCPGTAMAGQCNE